MADWALRRLVRPPGRPALPGKPVLDVDATWPVGDAVSLTLGSRNALNTYPDENPHATRLGNRYPPSTPFGFSGGFHYVHLNYRWRAEG